MPGVNRFRVMATLQAARAFILGLTEGEAYSWGLNRAIFHSAAKRGFKGSSAKTGDFRGTKGGPNEERPDIFRLGDDMAFKEMKNGKMLFTIGGKVQTQGDFEKQIVSRFNGKFEEAWKDALDLLRNYDEKELLSQSRFYGEVYRPVRDSLVEKWSNLAAQTNPQAVAGPERKPTKRTLR